MAIIASPGSFGQTQAITGLAHVFVEEMIREEITERLNVLQAGLLQGVGDLQGTGSDTLRITRFGSVGFAEAMTAMATETDPIVPTSWTENLDTVVIARYGLAKEETYTNQIQGRAQSVHLDLLASKVPDSFLATLRAQMSVAGAAIAASTGNGAVAWSFDDELDYIAAFHETEGFEGDLVTVRHPEQFSDLRDSLRNEPAYQFPEAMTAIQSVRPGGAAFDFLGSRNFSSFDVTTAAGAHQGYAYVPGALIWAVASTMPIQPKHPSTAMFIPEFGLILERDGEANQATSRFDVNAFFGVSSVDPTLAPQRRLISIND